MAKARNRQGEKTQGYLTRVDVPAEFRQWIRSANDFQKANGKRCYSLMFLTNAVLREVVKQGLFQAILEKVTEDEMFDTRGRPKGKAAV